MLSKYSEAQQCANTNRASMSETNCKETNMNIVAKSDYNFHGVELVPAPVNEGIWLTSSDIAKALGYASSKSVSNIYSRNSDEFTISMSRVIKMMTNGINNDLREKSVRVFSLRGCHLIAMFATTKVAKDFRKWVLDILDKEVEKKPEATPFYRYKAKLVLLDDETGEKFEIVGQAKDLRTVAYGLASDLGYRPNAFTHIPVNQKKLRKIH
ncbi:hypothetical protein LS33_16435 [Salmonella enterica]|nr:hypothetical protein [Salmonella enterica]